jgi:uncharacterized protein (TIGR02996 family)
MLRFVIRTSDDHTTSHTFDRREVTIGSIPGNDIVLGQSHISRRHARIVLKDDKVIVVDLKSTNGTLVNGHRITYPLVVKETDEIAIGDYFITCYPARVAEWRPSETELRFVQLIEQQPQIDDERIVYADWLEETGQLERAEFLRIQIQLRTLSETDLRTHVLGERMHELARTIDSQWRVVVARPAIENCGVRFELRCPKRWDRLVATDDPTVRNCEGCHRQVHYVTTLDEAHRRAEANQCVAIDLVVERTREGLRARDTEVRRARDTDTDGPVMMGMIAPD